jgi:dienelactone hydrolase
VAQAPLTADRATTRPRREKWKRRSLLAAAWLALLLVLYESIESYRARDYLAEFHERKGRLAAVDESVEIRDDHILKSLTLHSDNGLSVRAFVRIPRSATPPRAAVITLGGLRSGVRALDYVRDTGGLVVLAMDFPYAGKRSRLTAVEFVRGLPAMRRALLDTPAATMLGVDYLTGLREVDPDRIMLLGGSLGALVAPAAAAADTRISALGLLFGAGDLSALGEANLRLPRILRPPLAWVLSTLTSPMEPLKYIGRVAPRPVFMLNGTGDPRMPEQCARRLHDAAGEPKAIRWIDAGHVDIRDENFRDLVLEDVRAWMTEQGYVLDPAGGGEAARSAQ